MSAADRTGLDSFFPYRLAVAAEAFSRNLAEVYGRAYGLSREEWRLLFLLAGTPSMTSVEIARRTTLDKVQVSRAAQRLEDKGLISRAISPADRRLRIYACTEAGRAVFSRALPEVETRANEMLGAMAPEDRAALARGLDALLAAIAPAGSGAGQGMQDGPALPPDNAAGGGAPSARAAQR
ncbi:MarR family transcriptional regulator [Rhodovulum sp. 12E13]|uniref:MarR family winged helix-turn-helix transcriptional regulator n=1 Tax=Rhodovulum sp. 12E13 TaxID=2203891 RepID=UPI000E1734E5|nr:MarR family transcriptional regulator [Rhodovulum sp. 12E13]RDC71800.1 MarR family transcriptional regulator [Rhodovulum sp. 12E13]